MRPRTGRTSAGESPPAPGLHGGDRAGLAAWLGMDPSAVLDLSASLNPLAPDVGAVVARHLDSIGRYPDPAVATEALAAAFEVDPGRVLLTNGGAEAIALVAYELGGWTQEPDFSLYPRGPQGLGPRWRSDPHNPSGRLMVASGAAHVPTGIWDEAFYPLATGRWISGRVDSHGSGGAVVVGSLTKVFACPGLRLGYVVVPASRTDLAERLRRRQPAWSVNALAVATVPELLECADLAGWALAVASLRGRLVALLRSHGLDPEPSDANFVLVAAPGLRTRLAPYGILVRDCASFGLPDHVRIAVPGPAGMERLADALVSAAP